MSVCRLVRIGCRTCLRRRHQFGSNPKREVEFCACMFFRSSFAFPIPCKQWVWASWDCEAYLSSGTNKTLRLLGTNKTPLTTNWEIKQGWEDVVVGNADVCLAGSVSDQTSSGFTCCLRMEAHVLTSPSKICYPLRLPCLGVFSGVPTISGNYALQGFLWLSETGVWFLRTQQKGQWD